MSVTKKLRADLKGKDAELLEALKEKFGISSDADAVRFAIRNIIRAELVVPKPDVGKDTGPNGSVEPKNETIDPVEQEPRKFCKICGALLPKGFKGDYCPGVYSCGNHLHLLGQPHNKDLCAFCAFGDEVKASIRKRREGWGWEKIKALLTRNHKTDEVNGIIQAAKLELGEIE